MEKTQEKVCYFYARGKCKNAEQCPFLHTVQTEATPRTTTGQIKLPIQLLGKKKTLDYLSFSRSPEILRKVRELERLWLDIYQMMDETDKETLKEQRLLGIASWIFASNKIDHCNTDTVDETFALLCSPPVNALLKPAYVAVENTNKLLSMLLTNNPDVTSHLWCNDSTLHAWHLTLQSNISLNAGLLRSGHSSIGESLKLLRFILLKIGLAIDDLAKFREKIRLVFAMAAFASFYFVSIRPYMDANERLSRLIAVNILDSVCPLIFPMLSPTNTREKYKSVMMEKDPASLMHYMLDCAIYHAEKFVFY